MGNGPIHFLVALEMSSLDEYLIGSTGLIIILFVGSVLFGVLWLIVPFAIFGIKPRLERLITGISDLARWQSTLSEDLRRIELQLKQLENNLPIQPPPSKTDRASRTLEQQAQEIREKTRQGSR